MTVVRRCPHNVPNGGGDNKQTNDTEQPMGATCSTTTNDYCEDHDTLCTVDSKDHPGNSIRRRVKVVARSSRKRLSFRSLSSISLMETFEILGVALGIVFLCLFLLLLRANRLTPTTGSTNKEFGVIPFNQVYRLPESHAQVGDRTDRYAMLRLYYDQLLPMDPVRSIEYVKTQLQKLDYGTVQDDDTSHYDIHKCPPEPPKDYPMAWPILQLLEWNPDDLQVPPNIFQGLCVFDYEKDFDKAMTYRKAELPFVVKNDPQVARTAERWNSPGFMHELMGPVRHRTEHSSSSHFLYSVPKKKKTRGNHNREEWQAPTETLRMTFAEWLNHANSSELASLTAKDEHFYFRLIGCGWMDPSGHCDKGSSEYLFDELPFFQPNPDSLYLGDPTAQKGIHCRFGMKGIIAENHFDRGRNSIALLGGSRRYILAHPDQCPLMTLYDRNHPSARHSQIDWSNPDLESFPEFAHAMANEVVLEAGDVLYLPNNWFHHIISLEMNFQCNTRSGNDGEYQHVIRECGFP